MLGRLLRAFSSATRHFVGQAEAVLEPVPDGEHVDIDKLASALPGVVGRTIDSVFVAEHRRSRFRLVLTFADGSHYEFYGTGHLSGARAVDDDGANDIRRTIAIDALRTVRVPDRLE